MIVISTSVGLPTAHPASGATPGGSGGSGAGGANGGASSGAGSVYGTVTAIAGTVLPTAAYYYYPIDGGNGGIYRSGGLLLVTIPPASPGAQYAVNPQNGEVASLTGDGRFFINGQLFAQSPNSKYGQGNFHITLLHWSADGRWLAFRVETPNAAGGTLSFNDTINDGLWVYNLAQGTSHQVFRNQYRPGRPIQITYDFEWAADNRTLLVWLNPDPQSVPLLLDSATVINLQP